MKGESQVSTIPAVPQGAQEYIPLTLIAPSTTNPRKTFEKGSLDELTASVKKSGVLQPILVRTRHLATRPDEYELVAGERRYRAAIAAGLKVIPCMVRTLTDEEALELQVIENLQREDLHPLEEAEGYEALQKKHGHTVDDLAAKVGKSKAYVYARLKLCALVPAARKAFYDGKLNSSTALLVARIPVRELQEEAVKQITKESYRGGDVALRSGMSYREAFDFVQRTYMLRLDDAPFDRGDAELVPAAGPCTTCPKRTGNQKELFADVKSPDLCTDPKCFESKRGAAWTRTVAEAKARGEKVLDDGATKKLFRYGNSLSDVAPYVDLAAENYQDQKYRTWGKLIGKEADGHVVLAKDPSGGIHRLVPKAQVPELLKAAGYKPSSAAASSSRQSDRYAAQAKAERAKTILDNQVRARVVALVREKVVIPREDDLRLIAEMFFSEMQHESRKELFVYLDTDIKKGQHGYELWSPFKKLVADLKGPELMSLLILMSITPRAYYQDRKDPIAEVAKRYKVDPAAIRKQIVGAAKTKEKPAKKAGKAKGRKAA